MDPGTLILLSGLASSVGTFAAIVIFALIGRAVYRTFMDFDSLRSQALAEMRSENADLRRRVAELEKRLARVVPLDPKERTDGE